MLQQKTLLSFANLLHTGLVARLHVVGQNVELSCGRHGVCCLLEALGSASGLVHVSQLRLAAGQYTVGTTPLFLVVACRHLDALLLHLVDKGQSLAAHLCPFGIFLILAKSLGQQTHIVRRFRLGTCVVHTSDDVDGFPQIRLARTWTLQLHS